MNAPQSMYTSDEYLRRNPGWHAEDSAWKAGKILGMMSRHGLRPKTICEVGCGAGEVLRLVQLGVGPECTLIGYDIAPQAIELCQVRANERLTFRLGSPRDDDRQHDLALVLDVIEHLEDYYTFLRLIHGKADSLIIHIPLDMNLNHLLRVKPLFDMRRAVGHIHYFTKETALAVLHETGYEVVDHLYTRWFAEVPGGTWRSRLAKLPRMALFGICPDLTVRVLGGASLLVYAKALRGLRPAQPNQP